MAWLCRVDWVPVSLANIFIGLVNIKGGGSNFAES